METARILNTTLRHNCPRARECLEGKTKNNTGMF
jgi:hypothetical protein